MRLPHSAPVSDYLPFATPCTPASTCCNISFLLLSSMPIVRHATNGGSMEDEGCLVCSASPLRVASQMLRVGNILCKLFVNTVSMVLLASGLLYSWLAMLCIYGDIPRHTTPLAIRPVPHPRCLPCGGWWSRAPKMSCNQTSHSSRLSHGGVLSGQMEMLGGPLCRSGGWVGGGVG